MAHLWYSYSYYNRKKDGIKTKIESNSSNAGFYQIKSNEFLNYEQF